MSEENNSLQTIKIPTLQELNYDENLAFKNDVLSQLLNNPPSPKWVKRHPFVKTTGENGQPEQLAYLPIDKVEYLLTRIFQEWKTEVLQVQQLFNSVAVTIRLHYKSPITGEWKFHDGVGACGIQTDKGAQASDMTAIKQSAVMMALPSAKSYAIKDAADHLGKIFGRDLARKDTVGFTSSYAPSELLKAEATPIPQDQK